MNHVLIIGAGGVANVVAHKCAEDKNTFHKITLASRTLAKCDAIAAAVDKALGDNWQRGKAERGTWDTWVMTWETRKKPKRYYAIAAWDHVITAADGRRYRPLESLYTRAP